MKIVEAVGNGIDKLLSNNPFLVEAEIFTGTHETNYDLRFDPQSAKFIGCGERFDIRERAVHVERYRPLYADAPDTWEFVAIERGQWWLGGIFAQCNVAVF